MRILFEKLGGVRPVFYFGDLDPAGLRIPRHASARAQTAGLPVIQPHEWSYGTLFERARELGRTYPCDHQEFVEEDCSWLGPLAEAARQIFVSGRRLPQELLDGDCLRKRSSAPFPGMGAVENGTASGVSPDG